MEACSALRAKSAHSRPVPACVQSPTPPPPGPAAQAVASTPPEVTSSWSLGEMGVSSVPLAASRVSATAPKDTVCCKDLRWHPEPQLLTCPTAVCGPYSGPYAYGSGDSPLLLFCSRLHNRHVSKLWATKLCARDTKQTWSNLKEIKICSKLQTCMHLTHRA